MIAVLSVILPICAVIIACCKEPEIIEAVAGGLLIGSLIGSVFSTIYFVAAKNKNKFFKALCFVPIVFVGLNQL